MDKNLPEAKIRSKGLEFFAMLKAERPSIFDKDWWTGKVMDWAMQNDSFKVALFRFVDVLPYLTTEESLISHIEDYFGKNEKDIPAVFRWGTKLASTKTKLTAKILAATLRSNIETMARQFIIGENADEAVQTLDELRRDNLAWTVDILGEAAVSEKEALEYQKKYLALLEQLNREQKHWPPLDSSEGQADWGHAPRLNLSIKPTSFYSQTGPVAWEDSVQAIYERLTPLVRSAMETGAFICIDMEQYRYKDITIELYKRLRATPEFKDYPHLGVVLQAYLHDTEKDLDDLLAWARAEHLPISIRLVKGAYWDYEMITARQNGWEIPVYQVKAETDGAFERLARTILENHDICHFGCASHNIRSIATVMVLAETLNVPADRYEFQMLFGMSGPIKKALRKLGRRVRLYCAYGELLPGMGYLVRRLLENTSNESFLRRKFLGDAGPEELLVNPAELAVQANTEEADKDKTFRNEPQADFTKQAIRESFPLAIGKMRKSFGRTYPLLIGGKKLHTKEKIPSVNPANPAEVVGHVCLAGQKEIEAALTAAEESLAAWQCVSAKDRASYLFKAAEIMRRNIFELAACQIFEVGKQWNQAYGDVTEAIDFLEYYGREMIRLGKPQRLGRLPGELNHYQYQPKGLAVVIAPWNFPMAISCGMCAAALVTGNCVLYKPSSLSAVTGFMLARSFQEAGLPPGVFNFVPGDGTKIGDFLVSHPAVNIIAFTGSMEVGTSITELAAQRAPDQQCMKKVIAELGGKNAIIIDDDADLDVAVPHVLASAFGYQGQKCSACSRVIVVETVFDRFTERLLEGAKSLRIGPAEDPVNFLGPLVDRAAQQKVLRYTEIAKQEGTILLSREIPEGGYYVPLTIVKDITPDHRVAREEIFGPVLALMKAPDFKTAIDWANRTPFALTGGVFSRSPTHLNMARQRFRVGNLYLNRGITGALVGRQPFGGFGMSGIGSKAGGPDYLLQFVDQVSITENTMRRGFAPIRSDDEWV